MNLSINSDKNQLQGFGKINLGDDFNMRKNNIEQLFSLLRENKFDLFLDLINTFNKDEIDITINAKDQYGNYLILLAIVKNQKKIVKKLLDLDVRVDIFDQDGNSILFDPIKHGYNDLIEMLIEHNSLNIGTNITNIIDKKGIVPLLYCIKYKNIFALQNLLIAGADPNYKNDQGLSVLHFAVQRKNIIMLRMLLKHIRNIDIINPNGSTPLLTAALYNENEIAAELISFGADPNISENRYNYTPIIYAIDQNNLVLSKLLIDTKTNINHQDYIGRTPIHHAILNKSYAIIDYIFTSYNIVKEKKFQSENITAGIFDKMNIHPNLITIDGLTILHMFLYYYEESFYKYIVKVIPYANLNIQDNKGNTPMHLIFRSGLFNLLNTDNVFIDKKINVAIKNNEDKTLFDYVQLNEMEMFVAGLIDNYYSYLKKHSGSWLEAWQNECAKNSININCKELIRKDLLENKISVPLRKTKRLIHIINNEVVQFSTFTGTALDLIVGFKYLTKKYKNTTIVLYPNSTIDEMIEDPQHLTNFEIKWIYQRLVYPVDFETKLKNIIDNKKCQYILIPLGIILDTGFHSNCLIIDLNKKLIERFEPHGSGFPFQFNYNPDRLDDILDKTLTSTLKYIYGSDVEIQYFAPKKYLPKIGFQTFEGLEIQNNTFIGDPNGFCTLWCIWYLDYKLEYVDLTSDTLVKKLIENIRFNSLSFRNVIRNYSKKITDLRDKYLDLCGFTINDYISKKLTPESLIKLLNLIIND